MDYHGLKSLSLGRPPEGIDVRGVFEAGPVDFSGARYLRGPLEDLIHYVSIDDRAVYAVFEVDQPLVGEMQLAEFLQVFFLRVWKQAKNTPTRK